MNSNSFGNLDGSDQEEDLLSSIVGCTPIRLEEAHSTEIHSLIAKFPTDLQKPANDEKNFERFQKLIELYGHEPQLLDPILAELVGKLVQLINWPQQKQFGKIDALSKAALVRLRILSAVRGYKFLMRFLPHKVELLEPILTSLEYLATELINASSISTEPGPSTSFVDKQVLHILVIWLMIICKNPFNLTRLQQSQRQIESNGITNPISQRIINCMNTFLIGMTVDGGLKVIPELLAQILTRNPDNISSLKPRFEQFNRVFFEFQSELDGGQQLINQLSLANALFKIGRRNEMRPFAEQLLKKLAPNFIRTQCPNILVRDLTAKLLQRIALVLLRPRLATWRYNCGHRSLEDNLRQSPKKEKTTNKCPNILKEQKIEEEKPEEDDEDDIPYNEVEMLLGELLLKIQDRDNMVRWTAAKGVARICARIPLEMAAEVVSVVLKQCFSDEKDIKLEEGSSCWMGGCLTLAELCRRGCLLPDQVPKVISSVLPRALIYEQTHQAFMLAVNVRDAACYICWAFSRAYEASLLRQYLRPLAGTLLAVALFDREVNVRRAASAAFQENVGRNDSFPYGIPILQIVDYAEVARIRHCYLELSIKVAQFTEYVRPLLGHLCSLKLRHWDEAIRELAALALHRLASFDAEYAYNELLPQLCVRMQTAKNPAERHGAFLAVSALLEKLSAQFDVHVYRTQLLQVISEQTSTLDNHRAKGFSLMGKSLCRLIQAICTVGYELDDKELTQFHDILDTVVGDQNAKMAQWAVRAYPALMAYYKGHRFPLLLARMRHKYFPEIDKPSQNESIRCSSIVPLGYLHAEFLLIESPIEEGGEKLLGQMLILKLIGVIYDANTPKWVFARVAAIETICKLLLTVAPNSSLVCWPDLIRCLCQAADDYTATTNGNIGRFTRRAAILTLQKLLPLAYEQEQSTGRPALEQSLLDLAVGKIVERACESIDDLREKASSVLSHLADLGAEHPLCRQISEFELLRHVFLLTPSTNCTTANLTPREEKIPATKNGSTDKGEIPFPTAINGESERGTDEFQTVDWRQSRGFERLAALLGSQKYCRYALAGFVLSAGSVCGWTRENAFLAIANYLKTHKQDIQFLDQFLANLRAVYDIISSRQNDPSPVLILFRMLLNDGQLHSLERRPDPRADSPAFGQLCELTIQLAVGKCKSKAKLEAITVLGSLLQLNQTSHIYRRVLRLLLSLLDSPYVALREKAVEQLFEAFSLLGIDENEEEGPVSEALTLLSQTDWNATGNAKIELSEAKEKITKLLILNESKQND